MIVLVTASGVRSGSLAWGGREIPCALGRAGIRRDKREGDGATPAGIWQARRALWRRDRWPVAPATALPLAAIAPDDGWCDDPAAPEYNCPIKLPHPAHHETMWRVDALYDLVVVLGHNDDPPVPGMGSAIFVHVARDDLGPTEGCVALARRELFALVSALAPGDAFAIRA